MKLFLPKCFAILTGLLLTLTEPLNAKSFMHYNGNFAQFPFNDSPDPNVIFPMVTTPLGQLRGQLMYSRAGRPYYGYLGVPYAEPPGRFNASQPKEPWTGILDARKDGAICPQVSGSSVVGDENCLYLNVFFPAHHRCQNESVSGKLGVFLHIHGGSFVSRSASDFGSKYLLDECLVYVAINYRLGALGFLTTGDDVIPGNLGLKDQVRALEWTKSYITHFRGDPDRININGISAGAGSVNHLIASPMAKGLFSTAICSSGNVMNGGGVQKHPLKQAIDLGIKLLCPVTTTTQLKQCLLLKTTAQIVIAQVGLAFSPVVEPETAAHPFQTVNPLILMHNGEFQHVPLMTGFVVDEGINLSAGQILADPTLTALLNTQWNYLAPQLFLYGDLDLNDTEKGRISSEIRSFYFGDKPVGLETRQELVDLFSDSWFIQSTFDFAQAYSIHAPVYGYVMTYKGGRSFASQYGYEIPAMGHADDAQFTFYPFDKGYDELKVGTEQFEFSRQLIRHWSSFARTGVPAEGNPGEAWTTTTGNELWHALDIEEKNIVDYLENRKLFWKNLGLAEHQLNQLMN